MTRFTRRAALALTALMGAVTAWAQFPSAVVAFNDSPLDDPGTSQEMFRVPEFSTSITPPFQFIVPNSAGQFNNNASFRSSGFPSEGTGGMRFLLKWTDPASVNAWARISTFGGSLTPNPSLHLGGKVRFKIVNVSEFFAGRIGIAIGVRETGANVPQLANGGDVGTVEWVGVSGRVEYTPGSFRPIPVAFVNPSPVPVQVELNLATGIISLDGVPQGGGFAGVTGDGVLSAANNRGTLEHIAIINDPADPAIQIDVTIDELQFEAPIADPVVPPTVVPPIVAGDTEIVVDGLQAGVDRIRLYRNNAIIATQVVANADPFVFTIAPAVTGDEYNADQRVGGITSPLSTTVTVVASPPPYSLSFVIDEDADNCGFNPPGGWESVGAIAGSVPRPIGTDIFMDSSQWQTIDFPLDDESIVIPWLGGNGALDQAAGGNWSIDSVWITSNNFPNTGPFELFIDAIEILDSGNNVIGVVNSFEAATNYLGNVRGQSTVQAGFTSLPDVRASFDGTQAQRVTVTFPTAGTEGLGLYYNIGLSCNTSPDFTDDGVTMRWRILAREQSTNTTALPVVGAPLAGNQTGVRITNDATATAVQLYVNGVAVGSPVVPSGTTTDFTGLTLVAGDSVSAKQTIAAVESDFAYPRAVAARPSPPSVLSPTPPGGTSVTVNNASNVQFATASLVSVTLTRANVVIDTASAAPAGASVNVTMNIALANGDVLRATQTVNGATSDPSAAVTVGFPAPVIYAAPSDASATVRVQGLFPTIDTVIIRQNGTTDHTLAVTPGVTFANVPVSGLVAGDTIVAIQRSAGVESAPSPVETVTTSVVTPILCDSFESGDAAYQAAWPLDVPAGGRPAYVTDRNSTAGGTASLFNAAANQRAAQNIPDQIPTAINPMVWNVNVYDAFGPGATGGNIFAQVNDQVTGFNFMHVGLSNLATPANANVYQFRCVGNGGPNWINLTLFDAPQRTIGWHVFTVVHKGTAGIDVYVDGKLAAKNITQTAITSGYDRARVGPGVANNITGNYDDFCIERGPVRFGSRPPSTPILTAPIEDGDTQVLVTNIESNVTLVQVIDGTNAVIGTFAGPIPPNGQVTMNLSRALVHLERIRARVTNANGSETGAALEVGAGNGDILLAIGVRETGDVGPLGTPGGGTGAIEWIGAASAVSGAPQGVAISPSNSWQTVEFDPATDPILSFSAGDNAITGTRGVLEHLAISVNAASADRSSGTYTMYVDNVVNVGAGAGGSDFTITNFDGFTVGTEALFQEPTFSGSTSGNLAPLPSSSITSDAEGNGGKSQELIWFWKDTDASRWIRLTTSSVAQVRAPIIDITRPIRMDVLLRSGAPALPGDVDGDGDVDLTDLAQLLASFGLSQGDAGYIAGADFNGDNVVNLTDLATLLANFGL
ncbi:MAG: dockerin type I domain-containing protein [Phycisphaerae bacterium]